MIVRHVNKIGVAILGVSMAIAPVSIAAATTHKKAAHHTTKKKKAKKKAKHVTTTTASHNAAAIDTNTVCGILDNKSEAAKITSAMETADKTGNYAPAKAVLINIYESIQKDIPEAEATMQSTPANVQAAFKVLVANEGAFIKALSGVSSEAQLNSALTTYSEQPGFSSATSTVDSYAQAHCGG